MINSEDVVKVLAVLLIFGIPIIAILTEHQRKMAQLIHKNSRRDETQNAELARLQEEVRELRERVNQLVIAQDDRSSLHTTPPQIPNEIQDRLTV
jgi:cell division protein FtsB